MNDAEAAKRTWSVSARRLLPIAALLILVATGYLLGWQEHLSIDRLAESDSRFGLALGR